MNKSIIFLFFLFYNVATFSQIIIYKSNGNIRDSENKKISPDQVRELLVSNEKLLADYNAGRSKKTVGNVLLLGGLGFLTADLIRGVTASGITSTPTGGGYYNLESEKTYPKVMTYIGVASILIAIPVKIGFSKKIKNVVTDYNNQKATGFNQYNNPKLDLITNSNGLGLRLTLN